MEGGRRKVSFAKGVKSDEVVVDTAAGDFGGTAGAEEDDEFDWEAGEVEFRSVVGDGGGKEDGVEEWNGEVTFEEDGSTGKSSAGGAGGRSEKAPPRRRATARDKEFAELVHKAHLLCLLGRGRLVDAVCNDALLQASIISVLPASLGLSGDSDVAPNMKVLGRLVSWFMKSFRVFADGEGSSTSSSTEPEKEDQGVSRRVLQAVEKQAGSAEDIAAVTVALFRGLGFTTRYVTILNAAPLKPDADSLEASQEWAASGSGSADEQQQHLFSTHIDMETNKVASLARILARTASQQVNGGRTSNLSPIGGSGRGNSPSATGGEGGIQGRGRGKGRRGGRGGHGKAASVVAAATAASGTGTDGVQRVNDDDSGINASGVMKRKGDEEYEMQLAMAIAATAAAAAPPASGTDSQSIGSTGEEKTATAIQISPPVAAAKLAKGIKGLGVSGKARLAQKLGGGGSAGAVWSRKAVPTMHWAEVYCSEGPAGRWVHVDAAKGIVDGADKVEGAAAISRLPLRYALAFAGGGAKDVTRRYVTLWASVASLRVDTAWWDETLRPLKELEAAASAGSDHQNPTARAEGPRAYLDEAEPMKRGTKRSNGTLSSTNESSLYDGIPITQAAAAAEGSHASHSDVHPDASGLARGRARPRTRNSSNLSTGVGDRGALEDMEMETKTFTEPLPTNQQAYKSHHLYVLEKWLNKYEALYPKGPVLGYCAGQPIYPRTSVQTLHTPDRWLREGFKVKPGEVPAKVVKGSRFKGEKIEFPAVGAPEQQPQQVEKGGADLSSSPGTALYGKWQTQAWQPPRAVNGKVPKNERGQVDALSEKCIPPGTVHLRLPRLVPIVQKLGFDFAPAMVGFEIRKGRAFPAYDGLVVCEEFQDVILDAYNFQEEARYGEQLKKRAELASKRWFQLFHSISTRQRLQAAYEVPLPSPTTTSTIGTRSRSSGGSPLGRESNFGRANRSKGAAAPALSHAPESPGKRVVEKKVTTIQTAGGAGGARKHGQILESQHVHEFPEENQSYDEDSGVRTKTCSCGFTYYVEEM